MALLFLLLLAAAWSVFFLPSILERWKETPLASAERFRKRMALIAPRSSQARSVVVPQRPHLVGRRSAARRRRRRTRVLVALLWSAIVTAALALVVGGSMVELHLLADACLAAYIALLLEAKKRRARVHPIAPIATSYQLAAARNSVSGGPIIDEDMRSAGA